MDSETIIWQFLATHKEQILGKLIKLHETVDTIQLQTSLGFISTLFDNRSLTHIESQSLDMTFCTHVPT